MSTRFKKIMLVTNEPSDARGAERTARILAKENQAEVLLVDAITTPFHAPRYQSLSAEIIFETALMAKQGYLEKLEEEFAADGIQTSSKVLLAHRTSEELVNTAIAEECDLVVRYAKGRSSRRKGRFGQTAENLMRACPMPLLVTDSTTKPANILACINLDHGREENESIINAARQFSESDDNLFVLCCWEFCGREFMIDFIDEGLVDQTREESRQLYERLFKRLNVDLLTGISENRAQLVEGNPKLEIPRFCSANKIDVAVMCSASLNHPIGRSLGSTIEDTIADLPCGLLTVKPIGFQSKLLSNMSKHAEVV